MKVNEAPEKIIHNGIEYYRVDIIEDLTIDSKTFVKKDAFIEKAEKYLNQRLLKYISYCQRGVGVSTEEFIEEFKRYMKGE